MTYDRHLDCLHFSSTTNNVRRSTSHGLVSIGITRGACSNKVLGHNPTHSDPVVLGWENHPISNLSNQLSGMLTLLVQGGYLEPFCCNEC